MSGPTRRDVLMGGALALGAGGAMALAPRQRLVLMPAGRKLEDMVPRRMGEFVYEPTPGIVLPRDENSLSAKLYGEVLSRVYFSPRLPPVIVVMAYGPVQNDLLQLHRPEVCYSAVGFEISATSVDHVALAPDASLPVRELVARSDSRIETITYWTRIGDDLPTNGTEQRLVKLKQQWDGYIADGILVRLSCAVPPSPEVRGELADFARLILHSVNPADRPALIGRPLAAKFA